MEDPYQVLGLSRDALPEVIRAAYRALAQKYHPDRNPGPAAGAAMQALNQAYAILSDPPRRAAFDRGEECAVGSQERGVGADTGEPNVSQTPRHTEAFEFSPAPIRRTVRDVHYEIVFRSGSVFEARQWVDVEQRVKHDHRLFIGKGAYVAVEQVPHQRLRLRVGAHDIVLERVGDVLPVAIGQEVTLVDLRAQESRREPLHIALVNRHSGRWYALVRLRKAVTQVMPAWSIIRDVLTVAGIMACGAGLLYAIVLRASSWLTKAAGVFLGLPILWSLAPLIARTTQNAVEVDIREALTAAGLSVDN